MPPKTVEELAAMLDHTNLKPVSTEADIKKLCDEAKKYGFGAVCINPYYVPFAVKQLEGTDVKVCTVIGFPLGATTTAAKVAEAKEALENGASEFDMVINIGALKSGKFDTVKEDIESVVRAVDGKIVKVILETCYLSEEEIVKACNLARDAGAHFVKTSTGFGTGGADVKHVRLMRKTVGDSMGVKASGGIRSWESAKAMIEAGANRIGASSCVKIIEEFMAYLNGL